MSRSWKHTYVKYVQGKCSCRRQRGKEGGRVEGQGIFQQTYQSPGRRNKSRCRCRCLLLLPMQSKQSCPLGRKDERTKVESIINLNDQYIMQPANQPAIMSTRYKEKGSELVSYQLLNWSKMMFTGQLNSSNNIG